MARPSSSGIGVGWLLAGATWLAAACPTMADAGDRPRPDADLVRVPSWQPPAAAELRSRAAGFLATQAALPESRAAELLQRFDAALAAGDALDATIDLIVAADPRAAELRTRDGVDEAAAAAWLADATVPPFARDALRLWHGRELVRRNRFDEALPLLVGLEVEPAVDPATLLFLRGACQHWLLAVDDALESLDRLLECEERIPARYARIAKLLRADITGLESDSLDHVSRRMRDVTRRLDLGRAGAETRRVQDGVVESLDRLIAKLEEQQQQQQQAGQGGAGPAGSGQGGGTRPMDDSRPAGGRGPGEVRQRDIGSGDAWGNLPPHRREEALQQIGREFPPHYREAIEQYFKRIATGGDDR